MNRFLSLVFAVATFIGCVAATAGTPLPIQRKGIPVTKDQIRTIAQFHPWIAKPGDTSVSKVAQGRRVYDGHSSKYPARRLNDSGSSIEGWRESSQWGDWKSGWHELSLNGTEKFKWDTLDLSTNVGTIPETGFPFNTGFIRNGMVYGFYSEILYSWLLGGYGCFSLDGNLMDYHEFGYDLSLTDFSTYVISCAYSPAEDKVYAYTYNSDATGYQLQVITPDSWEFEVVNDKVNVEDVCVGFAYNPTDDEIYGITPDARFVILDKKTGSLSVIDTFPLPLNTTVQGMTYSPLDKVFVLTYSDGWDKVSLFTIDPLNPGLNEVAALPDAFAYRILVCPDDMPDSKTPVTPEVVSISFPYGNLSGKAEIVLPRNAFDGSELEGEILLAAYVDGSFCSEAAGQPGESVEIVYDELSEGVHKLAFNATASDRESAFVEREIYVGYGTPKAPCNIQLNADNISWDAVTESVDGGYIDTENLAYNVYLNGNKINDEPVHGCSFAFTMPDEGYSKYFATVEADNHGHLSDRGFSNDILHGRPLPLPFHMTPTETESELTLSGTQDEYGFSYDKSWHFRWSDDGTESFFLCSTYGYDDSCKWLFTPPLSMPVADNLVEVSFEVSIPSYDAVSEDICVGIGPDPEPDNIRVAKGYTLNGQTVWTPITLLVYPNPDDKYIGFMAKTSDMGEFIIIRNIRVSVSDRKCSIPSEVTNLHAEGLPNGELKASVSFKMPARDVAGNELAGKLKAKIESSVETREAEGLPGEDVSVEIATEDGFNDITVYVDNGEEGLESSTTVFTGVDVPSPLSHIDVKHNEDYRGLHLEWETPTTGFNGGYVDSNDISYALCLYSYASYSWEIVENLGNVNSYDYIPEPEDGIFMTEVGILTLNSKGNCGTLWVVSAFCGEPYSLPVWNPFGENALYPMVAENPDERYDYYTEFYYVREAYPEWISASSPYGNDAYCSVGTLGSRARIALPAFSTKGVETAAIEIPLYSSDKSAEFKIYAETYGGDAELIGTYNPLEEDVFVKQRFDFPAKFLGKEWVVIKVDVEYNSEEEATTAFAQYKIQTFMENDLAIEKILSPNFLTIGTAGEVSVYVENCGTRIMDAPAVNVVVTKDNQEIEVLPMNCEANGAQIAVFDKLRYSLNWCPSAEEEGNICLTAQITAPDMDCDNNSRSSFVRVSKDNEAVVTDLSASMEDDGTVALRWTPLSVGSGVESFENMAPFSYGDKIGDFRNLKLDDYPNIGFEFDLPFARESKAWQVINIDDLEQNIEDAGYQNTWFSAASGNQCLFASKPYGEIFGWGLIADRWLISPALKENSIVRFKLTAIVSGWEEDVEILMSDTDDDPDSFKSVETLRLLTSGWKEYEYELPDGACYIALRYLGDSDDSQGVLLDDIEYIPADGIPELVGYDIYRNGEIVDDCRPLFDSWTDYSSQVGYNYYNIVPVVRKNGDVKRGLISNTVSVDTSSVEKLESGKVKIYVGDDGVHLDGAMGRHILVSDSLGRIVAKFNAKSDHEVISLGSGVYMVCAGNDVAKIIVR